MTAWERMAVRALGSLEVELTVLERQEIGPSYLRVAFDDGGLLARRPVHPTMWVRLWFTCDGRDHQRAFTLVDPDPETGRFALEFALHEGTACDWARRCRPGDRIRASLLGSKPPWQTGRHGAPPVPDSGRTVVVGDSAALPAVNSLLQDLPSPQGQQQVEVWLEHRQREDAGLPVRRLPGAQVHRIHRGATGAGVVERLVDHLAAHPPQAGDRFWVALEAADTRQLTRVLRTEHRVQRESICATAYWRAA